MASSKPLHICDECGKQLATKFSLDRHKLCHQPPSLSCVVCDKTFREEWARKRHLKTHSADGTCVCPTCGNVFSSQFCLNRHEKSVHQEKKDHQCDQCNARYSRKDALQIHVNGHHGETPFKCERCHKTYKLKKSLMKHHCNGQPKPLPQCLVCGKKFKKTKYLKQHLSIHAAPKKQCDTCGRQFTWAASLKKHLKTCNL